MPLAVFPCRSATFAENKFVAGVPPPFPSTPAPAWKLTRWKLTPADSLLTKAATLEFPLPAVSRPEASPTVNVISAMTIGCVVPFTRNAYSTVGPCTWAFVVAPT
jgi:hypothetical protein